MNRRLLLEILGNSRLQVFYLILVAHAQCNLRIIECSLAFIASQVKDLFLSTQQYKSIIAIQTWYDLERDAIQILDSCFIQNDTPC